MSRVARVILPLAVVISLFGAGYVQLAVAQKKAESAAEAKQAPRKPRLPNYFSKVVTEEQRAKITAIQEEYFPQLETKRGELKALNTKQDAAIQKILSKEQWEQIETLRAEAKAKRQANLAAGKGKGKGKGKSTKTKSAS
jgi:hypothetical protein